MPSRQDIDMSGRPLRPPSQGPIGVYLADPVFLLGVKFNRISGGDGGLWDLKSFTQTLSRIDFVIQYDVRPDLIPMDASSMREQLLTSVVG